MPPALQGEDGEPSKCPFGTAGEKYAYSSLENTERFGGLERLDWHQLGPNHLDTGVSPEGFRGRTVEKGAEYRLKGGFEGKLRGEKFSPAHDVVQ